MEGAIPDDRMNEPIVASFQVTLEHTNHKPILAIIEATIDKSVLQQNKQVQSVDEGILDAVYEKPCNVDSIEINQSIYEYRDGQVVEDVRKHVYKVHELCQDSMQNQAKEGLNHESILDAIQCVYEVGTQFINFLDKDECKLTDARLLHMVFEILMWRTRYEMYDLGDYSGAF
ncbi:hypothetical protein GOP47_0010498 [Adiantum capillus-veneris]|uniref:Uncharacterized protein n=1 Tax=Adiantum capillus-veneris TaxID=13818 RepID=A0A9D4UVE4_ADICA|nr:hypothetical protein GOP47_0010498 [Adiantum capillus-veneris]